MTTPVPVVPQLQPLAVARQALDAALARQTAVRTILAKFRTQRDALLRRGDAAGAATLDPQIAAAQTALATTTTDVATATARLAKLSDALITPASTPEALVGSLDAALPITLLPVRLEARYSANAASLNVRIYPDQIHVDSHERELTPDEDTAGTDYWRARWLPPSPADPTFTAPWTTLTASIGARRAAWIVQATTPTNMNAIGTSTAPVFPTVPTRGTVWSRAAQATALPDRWAIVGIQGGRAVFRKWTAFVPDYLAATVSPDDSGTPAPLDSSIVDPDARWLVDFAEATRVGMATTIGASDLVPGYSLASGVDRLIAIGVDWTMTPDEATARLELLLGSHHFTDGVSFLSQGFPTNATAAARAGAPATADALTARLNPARADVVSDLQDASADKLAQLTGLSAAARGTLRRAPGAENREAECASHMFDALWESTLGYYLAQFMRPNLDDAAITALRDHAVRFVAPFGPAAPLRIGKQPYGVLPVVASARYRGAGKSPLEQRLADLLVKLRGMWLAGERAVPRMGRTNDPSKDVLEVLQSTPQSSALRFRYIYGPASVKNTKGLELHAAAQELVMRALGQFIAWPSLPEMVGYTADARDYPLNVPLVAPPDAKTDVTLGKNYLKEIAALVRSPGSYDALAARQDADALLEALLAHAAERELHTTTMRRVEAFRVKQGAIAAMPALVAFRTAEMVAVESPSAPASNAVSLETPGDVARLVIPALAGTRTVRDDTAAALVRKDLLGGAAKNAAQFLAALDWLADRPVGVLDRAARGVLDACSFRLDAWLTSLATRRLGDLRAARATGTHIGGYGWLDDLRPSTRADSLGYVHAPSIAHATTAAILRSGHLAHHDAEHSALNIDLSSDRVRLALHLLEGTSQGQPLAALLGYRFERGLRQRGLTFAKFIDPIRQLAPLRPTGEQPAPGVQVESIAARDVVDGVTLLERWRTQGAPLIAGLTQVAAERTVIGQELDALAATYDAVSDLLIAEAVHQLALGNTERAGATLAATDAQTPAPQPAVVRTPRTGRSFAQRVLIVLSNDTPPVVWPVANLDARARAEPRLNAWIGSVLGDPARIRVAVETTSPAGKQEVNVAALGLSPLSLVLASEDGSEGRASELEERIVHLVAGAITAPTADTSIRLLDTPAVGAPAGTVGLAALRALLGWLRSLITEHRAIDARDFGLPQDLKASGVDVAELTARSNAVVVAVRKARTSLANLVAAATPPKEPALRKALLAMADLGVRDALPNVAPGGADAASTLLEQTQAVSRTMGTALARLDAEDADFATRVASSTPPDADARAEHFVLRVRMLLGNHFPILPRFSAANGPELTASLGQQTALCGGDRFAPHAWLARLSLVRPSVDKLARVLSAAEVAGASAGDLTVLQIPFTPGERWLALPLASTDPQAEVAIVATWDGVPDPSKPLAGLFCDAWSEIIPSAVETTGVSFHYDAPGARAPQTILVAVPPDPAATTWSFDALLDTVLEAHDLSRIRAVGPKELTHLGVMLPCIYLPQSFSKDVPSVRLDSIVAKNLAASGIHTRVLGKS